MWTYRCGFEIPLTSSKEKKIVSQNCHPFLAFILLTLRHSLKPMPSLAYSALHIKTSSNSKMFCDLNELHKARKVEGSSYFTLKVEAFFERYPLRIL